MPRRRQRVPRLPQLLDRKIYKTGQTRGADDDVIYQNRVSRSSTVLIPYLLEADKAAPPDPDGFEKGFIVLIPPLSYFGRAGIERELAERGLELGTNALVFYQTRTEWTANNPETLGWRPAQSRRAPLGGQYVARIAATTAAADGGKIVRGFNTTGAKGAGIRLYEYANPTTISQCRTQLEALFWLCHDAREAVIANGMSVEDAEGREAHCLRECEESGLLDVGRLHEARCVNADGVTICPLCLERLSGAGFFARLEQAEGREVHDLTVTEVNLFHINELRYGEYNHRPYNLGWGHHHCNVVVRDAGISETLRWMHGVIQRNIRDGHFTP